MSVDRIRSLTLLLVVVLLVVHVFFPDVVTLDGPAITLILVASLLALAPTLLSAKLPGGAEFHFRHKIEAAEQIGSEVQVRLYREGLGPNSSEWPEILNLSEETRRLAIKRPADSLVSLRQSLVRGLRIAVRGVAKDSMPPDDPAGMIQFLQRSGKIWDDQAALMRVIFDVSNETLLQGEVAAADALRMIALADVLNDSFSLGYSLNFGPNPVWEESGLMCEYEHCIENMPLPGITRGCHQEWREHIRKSLENGFYDSHPQRKRELEAILLAPVPEDMPEEVDTTGSCPIFGHYCPGGSITVEGCRPAKAWLAEFDSLHLK